MLHIIYRTRGGEDTREAHKRRRHQGQGPAPFARTEWFDKRACFKSFAQELDDGVRLTVD